MQAVNIIKIGSDSIVCKNTNTLKLHILEKLIFDILDFEEKTGEKCLLLSS